MKKTKICALALSACMALGVFAGCDDTNATTTTESTTVGTTSEDTSAPTESSESSLDTDPSENFEQIVFEGDEQTYANTFISNFVETFFSDYDADNKSIDQLLNFAHIHFKINSSDTVKYENKGDIQYETFTYKDAASTIGKYFGIALKEEDCKKLPAPSADETGPCYEDGKIWFHAASGESYNLIGIVDYAANYGDGNLVLKFTIYEINWETYNDMSSDDIKKYYKLTPGAAATDATLNKVGGGTATVGVGESGSYFMIRYKTMK